MKTEIITIQPQDPEWEKIALASQVIRRGGLVIFPTETVYGIAADNGNPAAVQRLREVKHRKAGKPFSVLVGQAGLISNYTSSTDPRIYKLIDAFWPGPLTLIVPAKEAGDTIGVRMPDHPIALCLVRESQCTIAAPSANREGYTPPVTCKEALADLDGLVDLAIDGGPAKFGVGSSVVDMTGGKPLIQRQGVITQADIDQVWGRKTILFVCTGNSCRSVMAQYVLKSLIPGRKDVEIVSAGTNVFLQTSASPETISVLQEEGIDATGHESQPLSAVLLKKADLIFAMTRMHRVQILDRAPEVEKRVYLLKEFVGSGSGIQLDLDVPDPIGQTYQEYKSCLAVIKQAAHKIVELI
ncbi:MAG: threonylcarbamoyl-AMP synthase [Candidatus Omnitrophica bacterium]|nr:threonylcarbamoyl-AMP synthase [Candidatus Omnitrophota bacterium]